MGGPEMAPQRKWGAPKWPPKPPNVRSAPAQPGRSSNAPGTRGAPAKPWHPRYSDRLLGRDRELVAEDVEGGVRLEALHALVVKGEDRAPHRLHDGPVVLEDLLELRHDLAPGGDVDRPLGQRQQAVELGIGILRLVPRHAAAVGEG